METTEIRNYVDLYESVQDIRTALNNRISPTNARNKKVDQDTAFLDFCKGTVKDIDTLEKNILDNVYVNNIIIQEDIKPIYLWLTANKGIGHIRACGLIAYMYPISRFDTVSKLWAYAGYGVVDICQECNKRVLPYHKRHEWISKTASRLDEQNQKKKNAPKESMDKLTTKAESYLCECNDPKIRSMGQRKISGQLADFNPRLKKQVYLCVDQFVKGGSLYKEFYKETKENYMNRHDLKEEMESKKGGISKGTARIDAMARRKTGKLFLSHIWQVWRELEGLPVTKPYAFDILGHADYIEPEIKISDLKLDKKITLKATRKAMKDN